MLQKDLNFSLSLRARVFHPNTREHVTLLGPCFKTGRLKPLRQHPWYLHTGFLNPNWHIQPETITQQKLPHFSGLCLPIKIDVGLLTGKYTRQKPSWVPANTTDFKRFPFNNFTYCFTLFPKCFSSFPHGTCSLSVSRQYLALDGIYHPFWAAFPNNSTLWKWIVEHW